MKHTERFSNKAEDYAKYRPHYPVEIIPFLKKNISLAADWVVADIGSGTGISSELFIENGNTVFAVEPNDDMRKQAENFFNKNSLFKSMDGVAEATHLNDQSIDLIVVGQAFHWFEKALSKQEFHRIARRNSYLLLIWNERSQESPFQKGYEKMLSDFAPTYKEIQLIDEGAIKDFFSPNPFQQHSISHSQHFDFEGLKGRLLSTSFAPPPQDPNYQPMMKRLAELFDELSREGQIEFKYSCELFWGKIY